MFVGAKISCDIRAGQSTIRCCCHADDLTIIPPRLVPLEGDFFIFRDHCMKPRRSQLFRPYWTKMEGRFVEISLALSTNHCAPRCSGMECRIASFGEAELFPRDYAQGPAGIIDDIVRSLWMAALSFTETVPIDSSERSSRSMSRIQSGIYTTSKLSITPSPSCLILRQLRRPFACWRRKFCLNINLLHAVSVGLLAESTSQY